MKIETTIQDDHQAKITAEIDAEKFEEFKQRAARKLAKKVKIPGFRPGKAPFAVILRQLGEGAIIEEALDALVEEEYPNIIKEAGINPYGPGSLENISKMDPPVLEFVVPLAAEVKISDYRSLQKDYNPPAVEEKEFQDFMYHLRQNQIVLEDADRPAQDDDLVTVKLSATRMEPADGQDPVLIKERSFPILVRDEAEEDRVEKQYEWPFTGFSKNLVGMSAGDEKSFEYAYPEDAEQESYRGVKAIFNLKVEGVKARLLPDLDDDFAKSIGEYATIDELTNEVQAMLERQKLSEYDETYIDELLEKSVQECEIKYPPQMVEQEIDFMISNMGERLAQQSMSLELYLKSREMDMAALREETRPLAEKQIKRNLFLSELAKLENLEINQGALMQEANNTLNYMAQGMSEKEIKKMSNQNVYTNVLAGVYTSMMTRAAMERLRDIANGKLAEAEAAQAIAEAAAEADTELVAEAEESEERSVTAEPQNEEEVDTQADAEPVQPAEVASEENPAETDEA